MAASGLKLQHVGSLLRCAGSFVAGAGPLCCGAGLLFSCGIGAPGCVGSVVCGTRARLLRCVSAVVVARGLSCPAACGILVARPGIEPASPALEGRFFITGPPGKSPKPTLLNFHTYGITID